MHQLWFGIKRGQVDLKPIFGGTDNPTKSVDKASLIGNLEINTIDNPNFPRSGTIGHIEYSHQEKALGADESFNRLRFFAAHALTYKNHTLLPMFEAGTFFDNSQPQFDGFPLGGFLNLSGYHNGQLAGYHLGIGRLVYYYKLEKFNIGRGVYLGGSLEYGNVWNRRNDFSFGDMLLGGSVFIGVDTIFGPLYFAYGIAENKTDDSEIYLFLGQKF